jgi:hypothetical protein
MIRKAVAQILINDSEVSSLTGGRIYPVAMPQTADFPAVTYQLISTLPHDTKQRPSSYDEAEFQVNVFAELMADAVEISGHVRRALDGYSGTVEAVDIPVVRFIGMNDDLSDDQNVKHTVLRFTVDEQRVLNLLENDRWVDEAYWNDSITMFE